MDDESDLIAFDDIVTSTPVKVSLNLVDSDLHSVGSSSCRTPNKRSISLLDFSSDSDVSCLSPPAKSCLKTINLIDESTDSRVTESSNGGVSDIQPQDLSHDGESLIIFKDDDGDDDVTRCPTREVPHCSDDSQGESLIIFKDDDGDDDVTRCPTREFLHCSDDSQGRSLADNHENTQETHVGPNSQEVHSSKVQAPTIATPR
ncbi:hypothetical protein AC249_AIPGENE14296, partial [Exaiptasia diaphana]